MYCQVVLRSATRAFDREYTYAVPGILQEKLAVGSRVLVPFGSGNRLVEGVVTAMQRDNRSEFYIKPIAELLAERPEVLPEQLQLAPKCGTAIFAPTAML
jgi:primosomal protein N' (replication factor Y)